MDNHIVRLDSSTLVFDCNCIIEEHEAATGRLISREAVHNKITDVGITAILNGQFPPAYFGVGSGTGAPSGGDLVLGTERFRAVVTQVSVLGPTMTLKFYLDVNSGNGNTLTEAGLFGQSSGGPMFARITYAAKVKTSASTVTYTWLVNGAST
jgi:hypothetical protein